MPYTLISFHAHPDDEALLTAGTLARAAAEGHRVVLVVATAGGAGEVAPAFLGSESLAERRTAELRRSAAALGCARVELLGYADSGLEVGPVPPPGARPEGGGDQVRAGGPPERVGSGPDARAPAFAAANVEEAAARLAALLVEERADVLTSYDPAGGYGHPDHVQVHRVGARAAELAGTSVVLEATVDRDLLRRALRLITRVYRFPDAFDVSRFDTAYSARSALTHRVDVRRYAAAKRAAMAAHASQATADDSAGGDDRRTLAAFLRLPRPLFRVAFGREWYVERGRAPGGPLLDDVFASLRG